MKLDKEKMILFHPGKTGGTSIEHTFKKLYLPEDKELIYYITDREIMFGFDKQYQVYLQHADTNLYQKMNIDYKNYKTFCTVRRPYERLLSIYYFNGKAKHWDFETFVKTQLERHYQSATRLGYCSSHFGPQVTFAKKDDWSVDHIIHLEDYKEECSKAGLDINLHFSKTVATSNIKDRMEPYTQEMKDIVYSIYKEDFLAFGYDR